MPKRLGPPIPDPHFRSHQRRQDDKVNPVADKVLQAWTPKYVALFASTFSFVGAYVLIRLLLGFRAGWGTNAKEALRVIFVMLIALSSMALSGARCDIYVFCSDALTSESVCETDFDQQGPYCK